MDTIEFMNAGVPMPDVPEPAKPPKRYVLHVVDSDAKVTVFPRLISESEREMVEWVSLLLDGDPHANAEWNPVE